MYAIVLLLFCAVLLLCIATGASILYALLAGLLIFSIYSFIKGFSVKEILQMCISGVKSAKNVLLTFLLIGALTALWRAAGTIPSIVYYASALIRPSIFLPLVFLLNGLVSFLTGTSFGTAATMGVVCATMGTALHFSPLLVGGAVLSGAFFGDRCSPVSTSALLVSELTHTDLYENIRRMLKTAVVPFVLSCVIYWAIGSYTPHGTAVTDFAAMFREEFELHWIALLPAALILVLSLFHVPVKQTMLVSILSAVPICLWLQHIRGRELLTIALTGYHARSEAVARMLNGGGIVSMLRVSAIICISSAYSGIFQKTGLLHEIQEWIGRFSKKVTPYAGMLLTSVITGAVACNQTLTIMLANQICETSYPDAKSRALDLEDTAVVIAPLIPWSIAGGVPLSSIGASSGSILFAVFLFVLPLWRLLTGIWSAKRHPQSSGPYFDAKKKASSKRPYSA